MCTHQIWVSSKYKQSWDSANHDTIWADSSLDPGEQRGDEAAPAENPSGAAHPAGQCSLAGSSHKLQSATQSCSTNETFVQTTAFQLVLSEAKYLWQAVSARSVQGSGSTEILTKDSLRRLMSM